MHDSKRNGEGDPIGDLRAQWLQLVGDDFVLGALVRRHRERHRRYHNIDHVVAVVRHVGHLSSCEAVDDLGAVVAAAWFHDAIYEPRSSANERASARLAKRDLAELGWAEVRCAVVATMIEGTAGHDDPLDNDTAVLFDADLAILGADPADYASYVSNVRSEFAHVDDDAWRDGRAKVLTSLLDRLQIYATQSGRDLWEVRARDNLESELGELAG